MLSKVFNLELSSTLSEIYESGREIVVASVVDPDEVAMDGAGDAPVLVVDESRDGGVVMIAVSEHPQMQRNAADRCEYSTESGCPTCHLRRVEQYLPYLRHDEAIIRGSPFNLSLSDLCRARQNIQAHMNLSQTVTTTSNYDAPMQTLLKNTCSSSHGHQSNATVRT